MAPPTCWSTPWSPASSPAIPAASRYAARFPSSTTSRANYGSLIRGSKGKGFGPKGTLTSFDEGLEVLVRELSKGLDVRLETQLDELPGEFDHVVCTVPAPRAADLLGGELAPLLRRIPGGPVAVVALIYKQPVDVPDAFGFLVPRGQGLRVLGTLYDSSIFPNRAPEGWRLFRTLVGGRRDPQALELSDDELLDLVARDLERAWGKFPPPDATRVIRHPLGISQYEIGHRDLLAEIEAACPPWLRLAGSSYRGVALNLCIKDARSWTPSRRELSRLDDRARCSVSGPSCPQGGVGEPCYVLD